MFILYTIVYFTYIMYYMYFICYNITNYYKLCITFIRAGFSIHNLSIIILKLYNMFIVSVNFDSYILNNDLATQLYKCILKFT